MRGEEYQCAKCGGVFRKVQSDKKAMQEYHNDFPGVPDDEAEIVCDDCWKMMTAIVPPPGRKCKPIKLKCCFPWWSWILHPRRNRKVKRWLREAENTIVKKVTEDMTNLMLYGTTELCENPELVR